MHPRTLLLAGIALGATAHADVRTPVLRWQYGGCTSFCQTGWYSSPAIVDVDGDGQAEVVAGSYDLVLLNGATGAVLHRAASAARIWPGIAVADLNHDGHPSVVVGRNNGSATAFDAATLAQWFQSTPRSALLALEGRAALLRRLGDMLETRPDRFGLTARPSALFDRMLNAKTISAAAILRALLEGFGGIWRPRGSADDDVQGDVWRHRHAGGSGASEGLVPFHKLSQWLAYSLFEPFEGAGIDVVDRDALTALPEYRNGGLLIDTDVLRLANEEARATHWTPESEIVVEWRALTVTLLDELAQQVRAELDRPQLPLACILEGGTWAAGREIAARLRQGEPPLHVQSDGTVF